MVHVAASLDAKGIRALADFVQSVEHSGKLRVVHGQGEEFFTDDTGARDCEPGVGVALDFGDDTFLVFQLLLNIFCLGQQARYKRGFSEEVNQDGVVGSEQNALYFSLSSPEHLCGQVRLYERTAQNQKGIKRSFFWAVGVELDLLLT